MRKSQGGLRKRSDKLNLFNLSLVYLMKLALFYPLFIIFFVGVCLFKLFDHILMQNKLMCKVISLNVRGIRDRAKRKSIFSYLKDQKASTIYFLQGTYSELKDESIWQNEWDFKMYFSHGS